MKCRDIEPLLTSYVDGEGPAEDRALIDAHLTACPPCRRHSDAEATVRGVLRTRGPALRGGAPPALRTRCEGLRGRPALAWRARTMPLAVAAGVVLAAAVTLVLLTNHSATVLAAQLTLDHVKCFELPEGAVAPDAHAIEARLRDEYGWRMKVPPGSSRTGLRLVAARRCLYADGPVAHVMYRHRGRPLSLFMLPGTTRRARELDVLGHEAVMWSENDQSYLLIAQEPRVELERVEAYIRQVQH